MKKSVCITNAMISLFIMGSMASAHAKSSPKVEMDKAAHVSETKNAALNFIGKTWKTTQITDTQSGVDLTSAKENQMYIGLANYQIDGKYAILDLEGKPKSSGIWALTPDGKKRILYAVDPQTGAALFTRVVDVVKLSPNVFTYRIKNSAGVDVLVKHEPYKELSK